MTAPLPRKIKLCPDCNADNDDGAKQCWACHGDLTNAPEVVFADLAADSGGANRSRTWFSELMVIAVGAIVVCAVFIQSPGVGILVAIVWLVGSIILLTTRGTLRRAGADGKLPVNTPEPNYYAPPAAIPEMGRPSAGKSGRALVLEVLLILGTVALVAIAAFIALAIACIAILLPSGPFH